ncbi:MAG: helix-turn-helix transcriptional regulator [Phascolarctobacterium sp.]|uniref:helix-turn-helix domain-containing protein n=1 Tax=Phascolarctobacterium sp. TaxID=2049039 RepID=UPI0026DA9545|nr:helix-turn-helix transcriptional regulator [Phascolarctobacterium sp.]MDO4920222.1 helix-turn-helix transcriptional regulator [Phascolarctobacterium sp.]
MQLVINTKTLGLAMAEQQLSITELQEKAKISQAVIKSINAGKSVKPATLGKLAAALGVEPKELV